MGLKIRIDAKNLEEKRRALPATINRGLKGGLQVFLDQVIRRAKLKLTGEVLKVGGGWLRNSLFNLVTEDENRIVGTYGTRNIIYARIHEFGGLIVPQRSQYLTIPLPGTRFKAQEYLNTFVARSRAGNLLIFQRVSKRGKPEIRPLFVLKKYVHMPERSYLRSSFKELAPTLNERLKRSIALEIRNL